MQFSKSDLAGEDLEVLSGQTVRGRLEEAARRKNNKLRPSLSWDEVVRCRPGGGDACVLPSKGDKELDSSVAGQAV